MNITVITPFCEDCMQFTETPIDFDFEWENVNDKRYHCLECGRKNIKPIPFVYSRMFKSEWDEDLPF